MAEHRNIGRLAKAHDTFSKISLTIAKLVVTLCVIATLLVFSAETDNMIIPVIGVGAFLLCVWAANRLWADDEESV